MNEETFNLSIRKFLKTVGVGSQREVERAVDEARARCARRGQPRNLGAIFNAAERSFSGP